MATSKKEMTAAELKKAIASYSDAELCALAESKAATDEGFRKVLDTAKNAGSVIGASVNAERAKNELIALCDVIAPVAAKVRDNPEDAACREQLRELCGIVNAAFKAAQDSAKKHAFDTWQGAQAAKLSKNARDKVRNYLNDHMAKYGIVVDWQSATVGEGKAKAEKSDFDKARAMLVKAFETDFRGAHAALADLPESTLLSIVADAQAAIAVKKAERLAAVADAKRQRASAIVAECKADKSKPASGTDVLDARKAKRAAAAAALVEARDASRALRAHRAMLKAA